MAREAFKTSDVSVWIQPSGTNTQPKYIGCIDVGDITEPGGGIAELAQCFATDGNGWRTVNYSKEKPGIVGTDLTGFVPEVRGELERYRGCPMNIFFMLRDGGRPNIFTNYRRGSALFSSLIGEKTRMGFGHRSDDVNSGLKWTVTALPPVIDFWQLTALRVSLVSTEALTSIAFCNAPRCATDTAPAQDVCEVGYAAGAALSGATPNVFKTTDGGATWANTAADPFAIDQDIRGIVCFPITGGRTRIVVGLGTTAAGAPAKIAYSDDAGATWTSVSIGSTNAHFVNNANALFAYDSYNLWAGVSAGYIHYSSDGGKTWTTQLSGGAGAVVIHAIHFATDRVGYAVGASDTVIKTLDGGRTWAAVTATGASATLNTVFTLDAQRAWVGTATGKLYYTKDGGTTWTQRRFDGDNTGSITCVRFINELVGFMSWQTSGPVGTLYRTVDGGYTWEAITTPTNSGLTQIAACTENLVWGVGPANNSTSFMVKAQD